MSILFCHGLRKTSSSKTFCLVALPLVHPCLRKSYLFCAFGRAYTRKCKPRGKPGTVPETHVTSCRSGEIAGDGQQCCWYRAQRLGHGSVAAGPCCRSRVTAIIGP
jgi:hypothetical protein